MQRYAFYLVVFAAIISGIAGVIVKHMTIPATSMAWIRMATPTLLIGALLIWRRKNIFREGYKIMLFASLINAGRMFFFFFAYIHTSVANAIIVMYTWPIFAVVLSVFYLKESVSRRKAFLLFLSFIGIIIVYAGHDVSIGNSDFKGLSAAMLCAFLYACTVIVFKSKATTFDPFETIFFQNLIGALIFLPVFMSTTPYPQALDWTLGITLGVVIGIIMFATFFYGLRYIKASTASMIAYLEVISALTLGYLVLGETLTANMIIGATIIIASTLFLQKRKT